MIENADNWYMGNPLLVESVIESRSFETRFGSRVAIVGGGMLGTTLALRYRQAGRLVTLFEAGERIERRGYASIASRDRSLIAILKELNLAQNVSWENAPAFGIRFGALSGGRGKIVETLRERARKIGVDVRVGTPVREIISDGSGFAVNMDAETGEFDQVVLTVPPAVASGLMPALPARERLALLDVPYIGIITVSFVLERQSGSRYISRVTRGRDQFRILNPAALRPNDRQRNVIYVTRPLDSQDALFAADDRHVIEHFARAIPGNATIISARVTRMPHAFTRMQLPSYVSAVPGLAVVNSAHMGGGRHHLERTAALATSAFRELCAERIF